MKATEGEWQHFPVDQWERWGRGSSLGPALGLRVPGRRMVPDARDGGAGGMRRSRFVVSSGNIGVGWNDGSGHQKQHVNWRWGVGGASKWALQQKCVLKPPELRVEERGPRACAGGTAWEGWLKEVELAQRLRSSSHRSKRKTRELLAGKPRGTCGQMPPEGQVRRGNVWSGQG